MSDRDHIERLTGSVPLAIEVNLTLCLPRDTQTVPLVRHVVGAALRELGVTRDTTSDVELAVTEACANVVDHSHVQDEYEVRVAVNQERCEIRVVDTGHGFDFSSLDPDTPSPTDERGRGVVLMKALVDAIRFESKPEAGTIVHLVKELDFDPDAPSFAD
jgi:serine/threonine-protein kinase RsbW